MSQEKVDAAVEALKVEAKEVLEEVIKDAATKINTRLLPLAIDVATAKIPGDLDDAVASMAKPLVKDTLQSLVDGIKL